MPSKASELARRLGANAEAVCRHYLSNGYRQGRYWLVGDTSNAPGRSLYVRLHGPEAGRGAAGKWTDAATGEHGDLLDLIAANRNIDTLRDVLNEARRFLGSPAIRTTLSASPATPGSPAAARRLFAASKPVPGTLADIYLRSRGITEPPDCAALRFHARCFYRPGQINPPGTREDWPALVAAVTDLNGTITGLHRTWLDRSGLAKAPIATPRRAMGLLLGNGVRFGTARDVAAAGEGVETVLSLRTVLPTMPMIAALSANHLAMLILPMSLRRLYIALDNDPAGRDAERKLVERVKANGIETLTLSPELADFNDDLRLLGRRALAAAIRGQLAPEDVARFWNRSHAR